VANTSQIVALDRAVLVERTGKLGPKRLAQVLSGIDIVLGR
jgi:mRNA-degrading endonuclease toxin of MazEF toxin-antitoxin module